MSATRIVGAAPVARISAASPIASLSMAGAGALTPILPRGAVAPAQHGGGISAQAPVLAAAADNSSAAGGAPPFFLGANESFRVPLNRQVLYSLPIEAEGLVEDDGGVLVEIDSPEIG